jgi:meiosis-specific APC/C activator protein AMA1
MSPEVSSALANQRRRQAYSSPSLPTSSPSLTTSSSSPFTGSSGSGYSTSVTSPSSPEKSPVAKYTKPIPKLWSLVDGNLSDNDPFVDRVPSSSMAKLTISSAFQPTELISPSQKQPNHATIPMRSRTSDSPQRRTRRGLPLSFLSDTRPTLPSSFLSDTDTRIPRRSSEAGIVRSSPRSLRVPDRFVPTRSESAGTIEKFKTGKSAHHLTSPERMLRHGRATEDAFCYHRRDITPMAAAYRSPPNPEDSPSRNRGQCEARQLDLLQMLTDSCCSRHSPRTPRPERP